MRTKPLLLLLFLTKLIIAHAQMDDKFYFPSKEVRPIDWKQHEELKFKVDTDTISALILKPMASPKATILYFHGAGGNLTHYVPLTQALVENDFLVVLVDFRGYGKSTGTPTHINIATDGQEIFEMLLEKQGIQKTPMLIYGVSIGTQIATLLAKNNQERISGLILEGAMSSFTDIAAHYTPQYREFLRNHYISPYSAKEDIKDLPEIPKLIIHSKMDKDVPYSQGMTVFSNAPEPKEFLTFEGAHLQAMTHEAEQIIKTINGMLQPALD